MSQPLTANAASQRLVVLVNGLPAAGKTTLARALSHRLSLPLFSKDVIKEAHADTTSDVDLDAITGWCKRPAP